MGALELYAVRGAARPEMTPAAAEGLAAARAIVGGTYDRVAVAWRDGKRSEKELLLHLAGCPVKWASWSWATIPADSQIQIRERARAMEAWLARIVGAKNV